MDGRGSNSLFGNRGSGGGTGLPGRSVQQRPGGGQPGGGYDSYRPPSNYDSSRPPSNYSSRQQPPLPARSSAAPPTMQAEARGYGGGYGGASGGAEKGGHRIPLSLAKVDDKTLQSQYIYGNISAVSPIDFPPNADRADHYLKITALGMEYVVMARPTDRFPPGCISLSDPQRTWMRVGVTDQVLGEIYNPFSRNGPVYIGAMDLEVGFASMTKQTDQQYDQDELADIFINMFQNYIFAPGQRLLLDVASIPLKVVVKTVTLDDLTLQTTGAQTAPSTSPMSRGILVNQASINWFKDAKSDIKLKASSKRPAANAIISPDFKFEDMGIGGLDSEFSVIFRRAFASRIFPPGLIDKLGIMHVKGMLLYGPPGTGKTLIARQIGKMLNAREPKIINGPEVLNKFVGQSEENIRKLFVEAEKEYKEKGDESGLHIIIFDELDAVCKQRGSGNGGGTGVGDSVVNQLLSKLDGVDQLNNILLIGMTNRKDMIDDALLRPGRLEVQIEISLPDEPGRAQILKIHTSKMVENKVIEDDVDVAELAALTKNFSGAELNGLVKSATSFAFNRHIKVGSMANVSEDVVNMKVNRNDFMNALDEVKPAFGTDESTLAESQPYGVIHYSPSIQTIIDNAMTRVESVRRTERLRHLSVLLYGPSGSGKTALAAHIAMKSNFPFVKIITPASLVGFRDEHGKKDFLHKVFSDAYKSPLSILILDNIERLIEWQPVGMRLSNTILQALMTLLQAAPPKGHRLLIMATTSQRSIMDQLDVTDAFDKQIAVPAVRDLRELEVILREHGSSTFWSNSDINQALNALRDLNGGSDRVGVGVKPILTLAEGAPFNERPHDWFADELSAAIMRMNPIGAGEGLREEVHSISI